MTQREEFEAWLDHVTSHPDSTMPTPWQVWQAAQAAKPHPEPGKLLELADRIDHEKLWARPGVDRVDKMAPEQLDRLDAGVLFGAPLV